jgi:DNA mismatch repair protein MutL
MEMMKNNKIRILDDLLIDQIAAGEVVERPSSVVKELVENAIDAGATEISVSILNGGISQIEIRDDGQGMSRDDLALSVERFGTSKVVTGDDLLGIETYGFRGEALPSIASVSRLTITTRERSADIAHQLRIEGGGKKEIVALSAPEGTLVCIKDLFFNVPARRKFLKTERSESNAIKAVVADFALAKPEVSFYLYDDTKEVLVFPANQGLRARIAATKLIQGDAIPLEFERTYRDGSHASTIRISGYVSPPLFASRVSSKVRFIVNERVVKSPLLIRALRDGFGSFLKPGFYPSGVLMLHVPSIDVDVNVHPQKTEIRFRFESMIFSAVREATMQSLKGSAESLPQEKIYHLQPKEPPRQEQSEIQFIGNGSYIQREITERWDQGTDKEELQDGRVSLVKETPHRSTHSGEASRGGLSSRVRFLGQIFKLYLLFEGKENFAILDMHAAHERVTFFILKQSFNERSIISQELLLPVSIPYSSFDSAEYITEKLEMIKAFGIEAEVRDEEVIVRAIPSILSQDTVVEMLTSLLSEIPESSFEHILLEKQDAYLARLACHASIRRGDAVSSESAYALLDQLEKAELSGWCPHGRPVIWWISEAELEARFGRTAPGSTFS